MMFRVEYKNAARLAATVGLGLSLAFTTAPAVAVAEEQGQSVAESSAATEGAVSIGDATYASLAEAVAAVPENNVETTLILNANTDVASMITIQAGQNIKLDLNGHEIAVSSSSIRLKGVLTITDSSEGGKIRGTGNCSSSGIIWLATSNTNAKLRLEDGELSSEKSSVLNITAPGCSFEMVGGKVESVKPIKLTGGATAWITAGEVASTDESAGTAIEMASSNQPVPAAATLYIGTQNVYKSPNINGFVNVPTNAKGENINLVGGTIKGVTGKLPEGSKLTSRFTSNISAALPDGQYCAQQDGYWLVTDKAPEGSVAVIGGSAFDTLQAAIDSVTDGQATEITLLANTQENITIPANANIILDLGGCQITSVDGLRSREGTITVAENANLTVKGSGVVDTTVNGTAALVNNGTVTINGGTFTRSAEAEGNSYYVIDNQGTMTINGGTVSNKSETSSLVRNAGYVTNTLTINGGEFENDFIAIKNDENGVLNISGGKITSTFSQSVQNWGEATLFGGEFFGGPVATWSQRQGSTGDGNAVTGKTTISGDAVIYKNVETHNINGGAAPSVTVTGGTVKGSFAKYEATKGEGGALTSSPVAINDDSSSIVVSGGHFTSAVPEVLLDKGSQLITNEDGSVTVAGESTVAVVDGKGYDSLEGAIQNASNGSVVVLTGDVEQSSDLSVGEEKDIRLDLAGHDINLDTHILIVKGTLELLDSRAAGPVVSGDYETVTYQGGTIVSSSPDEAVSVQNGGSLILTGGAVEATAGNGINVIGNQSADGDAAPIASKLVMTGGYVHAIEYGIGVYGDGAALEMDGGVVVAVDNAAIGGNGTVNATTNNGGTSVSVSGGTVIGNITTSGYIACGIYQPQAGTLEVSGGAIVANGGVGILVRAGKATVSGGAKVIATGTDGGAVGDKPVSIPPAAVVVDYGKPASYPGATSEDSFSIEGGSFTSEYSDPVVYIEPQEGDDSVSDVAVTGGSFSGSPAAEMKEGFVARLEDGMYTVMERKGLGVGTYVVAEDDPAIGPADLAPGCSYVDNGDGTFTIVKPQTPSQGEHAVKVDQAEGGKVAVTPSRADEGDEVTITATPDKGKEVRSVTVTTKDGKSVKVAKGSKANTWTFEMPDAEVTVKVTFGCDGGELCPTHKFDDVDAGAWYHDAVDWAVEEGLLSGYEDGTLGPDGTLSRAQLATVLWRQAGEPEATSEASFADCDPEAFYAEAVAWADEQGIVEGYGDGTNFGPEDPVTREQLATILWRQAGEPEGKGDLSDYPDGGDATDYAVPALEWAVDEGVLSGFGDGTLAPGGVLSRAMLAAMLQRMGE